MALRQARLPDILTLFVDILLNWKSIGKYRVEQPADESVGSYGEVYRELNSHDQTVFVQSRAKCACRLI